MEALYKMIRDAIMEKWMYSDIDEVAVEGSETISCNIIVGSTPPWAVSLVCVKANLITFYSYPIRYIHEFNVYDNVPEFEQDAVSFKKEGGEYVVIAGDETGKIQIISDHSDFQGYFTNAAHNDYYSIVDAVINSLFDQQLRDYHKPGFD
jgi:hypothetical protein